jgi:hypothetical protein
MSSVIELSESQTSFYQNFVIKHSQSCDAEIDDIKVSVYNSEKYVRCLVCGKIEEIV